MRYKVTVEYDGSDFCGWQLQPGKSTVQGAIENALAALTGESIRITGSGRTDAGVHAKGQVFHFDSAKDMKGKWRSGLNYYLPQSVRITAIEESDQNFHARFSAINKTYKYLFLLRDESALWRNRAYCCGNLNVDKMRAAAELFLGEHDFTMLRSAGSEVSSTVRNVSMAKISRCGDLAVFEVTADGFLYNMVRKMAAALKAIGEGKADKKRLLRIVDAKESFSLVAPPCGLYLWEVKYD